MPIFHSYADDQPNYRTVALTPNTAIFHLFETLAKRAPGDERKPVTGRVVYTRPDGVEDVMAELTLHYPPR